MRYPVPPQPTAGRLDAIAAAFGTSFIDADGVLNRAAMRELVFNQPSARQRLENIIHPIVLQQIRHTAQQACAQGARAVVYDIPLLAESSHWRQRLQHVIVVDCDNATQIARVQQRNQLEPAAIQGIIQAQASRSQRLAIADSVLQNGKKLHTFAVKTASGCPSAAFPHYHSLNTRN